MTDRQRIDDWVGSGGWPQTDAELRLARRVPGLCQALDDRITNPIDRALAGLDDPTFRGDTLEQKLRMGLAGFRYTVSELGEMEEQAAVSGNDGLWVTAARLHAESNIGREAAARMSLSEQALPYVFPGELHPMMVDLLAIGERVIPALHVDWIRKLTEWSGSALIQDCKVMGLWFWPILRCLEGSKLKRPVQRLMESSVPDGAKGIAMAYATRLGLTVAINESELGENDALMLALVRQGDQLSGA